MNHEIIIFTPIFAVLIGFIVFRILKKRKRSAESIYKLIDELEKKYKIKIDYLEFRDEKNLKLNNFKNKYRLFVAYNIDNVRLIDNY